ncbi:MAG TPA: glycosyltransferase family 87 protein [Candidatus Dormibacteraeota bacterium]|nr:glycosyltransferase family 87 protein [Candidatus Dormibacteraeota bacterium]
MERPVRKIHLLAPLAAALALIPFVASIRYTADFGLAYSGGLEAWASGHPERLSTWFSTPFLALVMAVITRVASADAGAHVLVAANVVVWGGLLVTVWSRLQGRVPSAWWWGTLVAAAVFSPAISTIFWLNFNIIVFALALAGFSLVGRHDRLAALLIGLSVATKPILLLLPLALLLRRESRTAGMLATAVAAGLNVAGIAFLAWRAGDPGALNPFPLLADFAAKGHGPLVACVTQNYSPLALLCRLGLPTTTAVTLGVDAALVAIAWLLLRRLSTGWEVFALACLISPMLGPIEWATYQLLFAPVMLLLAYQFWSEGAPARLWLGLLLAFLMTELVWDPMESLARTPVTVEIVSYSVGQFAQFVILLTWARWLSLRQPAGVTAHLSADHARGV